MIFYSDILLDDDQPGGVLNTAANAPTPPHIPNQVDVDTIKNSSWSMNFDDEDNPWFY